MHRSGLRGIVASFIALTLLAGCVKLRQGGSGANNVSLNRVDYAALPDWGPAAAATGLTSFQRSCKVIAVMPVDQTLGGNGTAGRLGGKAGLWRAACAAAKAVPPDDAGAALKFFATWLIPYESADQTRITGYFEPVYPGSRRRRHGYDVPIYGRPDDLVHANLDAFRDASGRKRIVGRLRYGTMVPYYTRAQIDHGAISRQAHAIAWVPNRVDAYMIQLQGAARLRLRDGKSIVIGFAGTNGRTYTPIGKLMISKGDLKPDKVSLDTIRAWLLAHPAKATPLMQANKNYVFFKRIKGVPANLGAPGALDVPLTPEGSLAVDEKAVPLGAPVYVATPTLDRLTTAQDVDIAANGIDAAQIFFGIGQQAAARASATRQTGRLFILLPRQPAALAAAQPAAPPASRSAQGTSAHD